MRHKYIASTYIFILIGCSIFAQQKNPWISFQDVESELIGFKDLDGNIKIAPKYMGFTTANRFDHIMAVMEENNGDYISYYVTKSGKIVGRDSLYIFDNGADCESEGFIRFRDKETDKVGMFNSEGEIIIPAKYNDLTKVNNGMVVALIGAKKKYWDNHKDSGCNHFSWTGGKEYLIDTNDNVIFENFKYESSLNFFSLSIELKANKDSIRQTFPGVDGKYYNFIDYRKEFQHWISSLLSDSLSIESLIEVSYNNITYWKESNGWTNVSKEDFLLRNFKLIKIRLNELSKENVDYNIFIDGLNPFMYEGNEFEKYFNNCGEAYKSKYPVINLVISKKTDNDLIQDHFDFLRTEEAYKLISVTIRNGELD